MSSPSPARRLNVWIVNPYGWLPNEGWRDYRSAPLAEALARRGHQVRWFLSDIEHRSRTKREVRADEVPSPPGVALELVPCRPYHRNMSLDRVRYERSYAAGFARRARPLPPPDVIVLADPALFFGGPVAAYARQRGIPLILDIIDLWPEMFRLMLPRRLRAMDRLVFAPLYRRRDRLAKQAAAIIAVTGDYLEAVTRRVEPPLADVVYLGRDRAAYRAPKVDAAPSGIVDAIYAGNLGDAYDMPTLLATIERMAVAQRPIRFTLAGDGPWRERVAALAERFPEHVRFLGRVAPERLPDIFATAQIGLATYAAGSTVSMPTKLFDYLATGLATVGSMGGEAATLLRKGAGKVYAPGSSDSLAAALETYIAKPAELAAAREFAFRSAAGFEQNAQLDRYVKVIEKVGMGRVEDA